MATLSSKRQITLPKDLCDQAGIAPGARFRVFCHNGHITLVQQHDNASMGVLRHLRANNEVSEHASRDQAISGHVQAGMP